jgi:molybdate transport system ATP-binding protein
VSEGTADRVTLDCGFSLDALVTRQAREELGIGVGARVVAVLKATAVHLVLRG